MAWKPLRWRENLLTKILIIYWITLSFKVRIIAREHCFYLQHVPRCCIVLVNLLRCPMYDIGKLARTPQTWWVACIGALWLVAGMSQQMEGGDSYLDLSTTSLYAPCGLLGCGGVKPALLKGKFTHHNLDNSLNHYIIQNANNWKWALLLLATRFSLLYSISKYVVLSYALHIIMLADLSTKQSLCDTNKFILQ